MNERVLLLCLLLSSVACGGGEGSAQPAQSPDAAAEEDAGVADAGTGSGADADIGDAEEDAECPFTDEEPPIATPEIYTPRWAFEPWISKDISDSADSYAFVEGFKSRDIPVGVLVIDSPWETNYNTFIPNEARYPELGGLVSDMRDRDVRVVMWVTQMVNKVSFDPEVGGGDTYEGPAENFDEGQVCGFFVEGGDDYFWWKGYGAAVDFFNPKALAWWHRQQDAMLEMGIAGWKLDFGESYIDADPMQTAQGLKSLQEYSEEYYRDSWSYGVSKVGIKDFVTMVRPYDESYDFEGRFHARPEHAPVGWVGDNRRDWVGFIDALDHIFRSAAAGYVVVGSDVGGYLDRNDRNLQEAVAFDQSTLDQWTAVGALTPFMQLHGRANLEPWNVGDDPASYVEIYRHWAKFHHALVDFFYSLSREAYANAGTIIHPVGEEGDWAGDWRFVVGEAFLVAPLLDASGVRDVLLPEGARWYDWWDPAAPALEGGQRLTAYDGASERLRTPLFVREGAILPLRIEDDAIGIGSSALAGHQTILIYPSPQGSSFSLHEEDEVATTVSVSAAAPGVDIELSRARRPLALRVRSEAAPALVSVNSGVLDALDGVAAFEEAAAGYYYDEAQRSVWIKTTASPSAPVTVEMR